MSGVARLSEQQKRDWLRLTRSEGIGPRTFSTLINRYGGASAALEALPELARSKGKPLKIASEKEIDAELAALAKCGAQLIVWGESQYPALLRQIDSPPPVLSVLGDASLLNKPCLAMVGARNSSGTGQKLAAQLALDIGRAGFVVVSGLARGIDGAAHRAALNTGTVAVIAGGFLHLYPPEHKDLFESIAAQGCIVTEMAYAHMPRGRDFPRRNRIISGLSHCTLVVEASERSGSLITARFAAEQGRDVYACPGSPADPRSSGNNRLLKQGASLVLSAEDVIVPMQERLAQGEIAPRLIEEAAFAYPPTLPLWDELDDFFPDIESAPKVMEPYPEFELEEEAPKHHYLPPEDIKIRILELLGATPLEIDDLVRLTGVEARAVHVALMDLEADERIVRLSGNRITAATFPISAHS